MIIINTNEQATIRWIWKELHVHIVASDKLSTMAGTNLRISKADKHQALHWVVEGIHWFNVVKQRPGYIAWFNVVKQTPRYIAWFNVVKQRPRYIEWMNVVKQRPRSVQMVGLLCIMAIPHIHNTLLLKTDDILAYGYTQYVKSPELKVYKL